MAGQVRERVLCPCSHTHTHAFIPMLLWKWKKKANPQTTARGACANLLLTCENELPRLITWQRLDHSCQPKTRVVCQQETKSDTCWKGFVCSSFLIFFPFLRPPPPPLLRISPLAITYYLPCSCTEALWSWSTPRWDKLFTDMEQERCQPQGYTIITV